MEPKFPTPWPDTVVSDTPRRPHASSHMPCAGRHRGIAHSGARPKAPPRAGAGTRERGVPLIAQASPELPSFPLEPAQGPMLQAAWVITGADWLTRRGFVFADAPLYEEGAKQLSPPEPACTCGECIEGALSERALRALECQADM